MKNRKMNNVISFLLVLMMILSFSPTISASSEVEHDRLGSIALTLRDQKDQAPIGGGEITIYKVANANVADNNLSFTFTEDFEDCGLSIDDYYKTEFAEGIAHHIWANKTQGNSLVTNAQGVAEFTGLTHGIYMIAQTKAAEGFSAFAPFIAQLPTTMDSRWVYDLDVTPKVDVIRYTNITVQKVWNDDNGAGATKRPESVKIQLLLGGEVVDAATLSDKNEWKHTWTDLIERDDYSVKEVNVPKGYKATYKQSDFTFTVTNTSTLAQTGQLNWPIPILIIVGMILIVVGYILLSRGKRHE